MKLKYYCACLLAMLLVGCAGKINSEMPTPEDTVVQLNILISLDEQWENQASYEILLKKFEQENSDIVLIPSYVFADTEAILKLLYAPNDKKSFQLAILGAEQLYQLLDLKLIEPLDSYILQDKGWSWLNDLNSYTMGNATYGGNVWSLPIMRNAVVAYVNTELTGEIEQPLTLGKLADMVENDTQTSSRPFAVAQWERLLVRCLSYNQDMPTWDKAGALVAFHTSEKADLLDRIAKMYGRGQLGNGDTTSRDNMELFLNGKLPVLLQESQLAEKFTPESSFPIEILPLYLDEETTFPTFGSNGYLIKQPDKTLEPATWRVLDWMIENNIKLQVAERSLPLSHTMQQQLALETHQEGVGNFTRISAVEYNSFDSLAVYQRPKIFKIAESAIHSVLNDAYDADDTLTQLQNDVMQILKKYPLHRQE